VRGIALYSDERICGKSLIPAAHLQKLELLRYNSAFQHCFDLPGREIGAVDFFMPARSCALYRLVVVFACKKVKIPYLWLAGHKQLQSTSEEHFAVILTKRTVISSIDLIVYVFLSVQIFDVSAACDHGIDQFLDLCIGQQAFQIQQGNAVMAAQHVYTAYPFAKLFVRPRRQQRAVPLLQGVQNKSWQEKVVHHVAFLCYFFVGLFRISRVDLRQERDAAGAGQPSQPAEQLPSARLVEKIAFANCFGRIGKGVQTHDFGAVGSQLCQYLFVVFPDKRRLDVQVHLAEIPTLFFQAGGNLGTVFVPAPEFKFRGLAAGIDRGICLGGQNLRQRILDSVFLHKFLFVDV